MRLSRLADTLFLLAGALLIVNAIGCIHYRQVDAKDARQVLDRTRLSAEEFWAGVPRLSGESDEEYLTRLTDLVYDRMVHANVEHTRPTFFENFLLWTKAQGQDYWRWSSTRHAIRLGGGQCSQMAMVLNNILMSQGIKARILTLNGHVLNEVWINGRWVIADADYNRVIPLSLREIENNPDIAFEAYRSRNYPDTHARLVSEYFASHDDNWHFSSTLKYVTYDSLFEILALYFIWLIPGALICAGLLCRFASARR